MTTLNFDKEITVYSKYVQTSYNTIIFPAMNAEAIWLLTSKLYPCRQSDYNNQVKPVFRHEYLEDNRIISSYEISIYKTANYLQIKDEKGEIESYKFEQGSGENLPSFYVEAILETIYKKLNENN